MGIDSGGRGEQHGIREGAGGDQLPPRGTRPDRTTRYIETTRGILSYLELAPFLAENVAIVEARIYRGEFNNIPLGEEILRQLHREISSDLVPQWGGHWRTVDVCVGNLRPVPPHRLHEVMREYSLDLQARWEAASSEISDLTLELLAFAEGRFLSIHPFTDLNGRVVRLFLREILRRLDFPQVSLTPAEESKKRDYYSALEASDQLDFRPLINIWRTRLAER